MAAENNDNVAMNKQSKRQKRAEDLGKYDNLTALITAVDAGAFNDVASTIGSAATTDFRSDNDERTEEAKALISAARVMAEWFQIMYDSVSTGSYPADYPFEEAAWHHVDETRMKIFDKYWILHRDITERIFPTNSKDDRVGRKAAGNNIQVLLDQYFEGRNVCQSKYTKDDPDFNEPPPTRNDFISFTPHEPPPPLASDAAKDTTPATTPEASPACLPPPPIAKEDAGNDDSAGDKDSPPVVLDAGRNADDAENQRRHAEKDAATSGWVDTQNAPLGAADGDDADDIRKVKEKTAKLKQLEQQQQLQLNSQKRRVEELEEEYEQQIQRRKDRKRARLQKRKNDAEKE